MRERSMFDFEDWTNPPQPMTSPESAWHKPKKLDRATNNVDNNIVEKLLELSSHEFLARNHEGLKCLSRRRGATAAVANLTQ